MNILLRFLSSVNSPELQERLLWIKLPFIATGLFFFGFVIFALFRTSWIKYAFWDDFSEFIAFRSFGLRKMARQWRKLLRQVETGGEADYKLAIIEAETMLDGTLRRMGFSGKDLDDRLSQISLGIAPNLEELRAAHQVRNNIVHDPDYRLSLEDTRRILSAYETTFRSLDLV